MNNGLTRYYAFEDRLKRDFGVGNVRCYYIGLAGDGVIAVRGDEVFFKSDSCYTGGFNESLYNVLCHALGLINMEDEYRQAVASASQYKLGNAISNATAEDSEDA